ncbi:MAG: HRDC domain-containing protein [Kiritimatiellae bacterium]|nr:HRDC domain-containing protein [Kiritimatiellia bacterium]
MQIRVITMRYSEGLQGFSEDALRRATFGREVLAVQEHFFTYGNVPHLALVLTLGDVPGEATGSGGFKPRDPNAPNPEETLPEECRGIYRSLKAWRNETAKAEGRPAYAIARNAQLAELVRAAPKTLAALKEIPGFGDGFCEKYGKAVLSMLAEVPAGDGGNNEGGRCGGDGVDSPAGGPPAPPEEVP